MKSSTIWQYWGKALPRGEGPQAHAFVYHCLDVVAVADAWVAASASLRGRFKPYLPWLRFFVALHDFGKLCVRFQVKSRDAIRLLGNYPDALPDGLDLAAGFPYAHGPAGFLFLKQELGTITGTEQEGAADAQWNRWDSWMGAVAGHHGAICIAPNEHRFRDTAPDRATRAEWLQLAAQVFLAPAGLSLRDDPPSLSDEARAFIAGFCAICDWLGSNEAFPYCIDPIDDLEAYLAPRRLVAEAVLRDSGIVRAPLRNGGIATALDGDKIPQQVQCYVDGLPLAAGLTLIEAPTGSGKTEAAIGLASRLLANDLADGIVFALPTQATANAMLPRLESVAPRLYPDADDINLVLAHGRARFNADAIRLRQTVQNREEATVHQAEWLSQSRKRVFLGQIGVCTIDQVLLSVLPVRHHFVRSFSVGRSVLIVDEVHAYDAYMYGLLEKVLRQQQAAGGSAILLSATLSRHQREALIRAWCPMVQVPEDNAYPLLTQVAGEQVATVVPGPAHQPLPRGVRIETLRLASVVPDDALLDCICEAATRGARIAVIVNLVADAQRIARQLQARNARPVDLFHSRYRFRDRMQREQEVLAQYGKGVARDGGRILVATQVVEQSLDLDFDWMVTQLCPADLLFQRLGRLHRHHDTHRPTGFETPRCTVLLRAEGESYGLHGMIYGDVRALWRTEQRLLDLSAHAGIIEFPRAYRDWVEHVYDPDDGDLPEDVSKPFLAFLGKQHAAWQMARQLTEQPDALLEDDEAKIVALTRDAERSLSVVPVLAGSANDTLLDGVELAALDEWVRSEALMLETVNVPGGWKRWLPERGDEGTIRLPMQVDGNGWVATCAGGVAIHYDKYFGLERSEG